MRTNLKTLAIRVPNEIYNQIEEMTRKANEKGGMHISKAEIARRILEKGMAKQDQNS